MTTKAEIIKFLAAEFPHAKCTVEAVGGMAATIRHEIGIVPLAVTTNLTINFMRKPAADRAIVGVCKLLKLGKSLAVGEVSLYSEGIAEPVAHSVGTYAIPR
jgi:acyl-coenzyme A thioesterase PaaI-like protein